MSTGPPIVPPPPSAAPDWTLTEPAPSFPSTSSVPPSTLLGPVYRFEIACQIRHTRNLVERARPAYRCREHIVLAGVVEIDRARTRAKGNRRRIDRAGSCRHTGNRRADVQRAGGAGRACDRQTARCGDGRIAPTHGQRAHGAGIRAHHDRWRNNRATVLDHHRTGALLAIINSAGVPGRVRAGDKHCTRSACVLADIGKVAGDRAAIRNRQRALAGQTDVQIARHVPSRTGPIHCRDTDAYRICGEIGGCAQNMGTVFDGHDAVSITADLEIVAIVEDRAGACHHQGA